jgi:hypothetical protein
MSKTSVTSSAFDQRLSRRRTTTLSEQTAMTSHLADLLSGLERLRAGLARGEHDLASARSLLASTRLGLLRLRRRAIAIVLSDGVRSGANLMEALDDAIDALRRELSARQVAVA